MTTLIWQRVQAHAELPALRRAMAAVVSLAPIRRRVAAGSGLPLWHVSALIVCLLTAAYLPVSLTATDGVDRWTAWGFATVVVATADATWLVTGRWASRRPAAGQPGHWSLAGDEPPRVVREPESGWWAAQEPGWWNAPPAPGSWDAIPDEGPTAVTVAVVGECETRWDADAVVSRLAELAVNDELLVVYGSGSWSRPGHQAVLVGLRGRLPRHHVVALHVAQHDGELGREAAAALGQFLEDGSLPVVVAPAAAVHDVTAELSSYLRADRVLRVAGTVNGADLHQVWRRQAAAGAN